MPKKHKTRQEKKIADLRRKTEVVKPESQTLQWKPSLNVTPSSTPLSSPITQIAPSSIYLKKDLTKTLILSILAISLELILYFWLK